MISLLTQEPLLFVMVAVALIVSLSIHEFAHAMVADKLGDNTPRLLGRVTIDPRAHLDPVGSLLILFAGFGWGKPVPFNPINLQNPKRDAALIAVAGPASNFVLAAVLSILLRFVDVNSLPGGFLYLTAFYNVMLGVFNLLPVHPLDGFKVVAGMLPVNLYMQWMQMERYGLYILLALVLMGQIDTIITPIINGVMLLLRL